MKVNTSVRNSGTAHEVASAAAVVAPAVMPGPQPIAA